MQSKKTSVLVVDNDVRMLRLVQRLLELEGYRVSTASSGEDGLAMLDQEMPDLILLDIIMPGMDGCAMCRRIREFSQVPIITVTAKDNDQDKVEMLDAGADDYVIKPFSATELVARVKAVLRRAKPWEEYSEPSFQSNELLIDFVQRRVYLRDKEANLTATEYKLLSYLARNAGRVVTTDQILEKLWGWEYLGEPHLLQVTIARLRQKLKDDAKSPRYILTRPGIGYSMVQQS